jgi:adenine deaminase
VPAYAEGRTLLPPVPVEPMNRFRPHPISPSDLVVPALAFVHGFGLRKGAIASSVAHDSHNLIAVGADFDAICMAVNAVMGARGGLAVVGDGVLKILPLPVGGLMSLRDGDFVAREYAELQQQARRLGTPFRSPLMTLSFLALLVIPELKLSDRGLFDGRAFRFVPLFADQESAA